MAATVHLAPLARADSYAPGAAIAATVAWLEQALAMIGQQKEQVPEEIKPAMELLEKAARERLDQLKADAPKKEGAK